MQSLLGQVNFSHVCLQDHRGKQPYHFDSADGTITIMLQNASIGGEIEAVPNALGNEDLISRVLREDPSTPTKIYKYTPGDLVLFNGTRCLHRVRECAGPDSRCTSSMHDGRLDLHVGVPAQT